VEEPACRFAARRCGPRGQRRPRRFGRGRTDRRHRAAARCPPPRQGSSPEGVRRRVAGSTERNAQQSPARRGRPLRQTPVFRGHKSPPISAFLDIYRYLADHLGFARPYPSANIQQFRWYFAWYARSKNVVLFGDRDHAHGEQDQGCKAAPETLQNYRRKSPLPSRHTGRRQIVALELRLRWQAKRHGVRRLAQSVARRGPTETRRSHRPA